MNKLLMFASSALIATSAATAFGQGGNPDLRIRADFRTPHDGSWPDNQSVGHASFRVHSRFGHVYYGGVIRLDDFKFNVQFDYSEVSGVDTQFPGSIYDADYDVYINNSFVGRVDMNAGAPAVGEFTYDSRHPSPPDLPLPPDFPSPVNTFDTVRVFVAAAGAPPTIGSPLPAGTPLFTADLIEEFARGDVNQDREVDLLDYAVLAAHYDPYQVLGEHLGPANGDFSGDNLCTVIDYNTLVANWTSRDPVPPEPAAVAIPCPTIDSQPSRVNVCDSSTATFHVDASSVVAASFGWQVQSITGAWLPLGASPVSLGYATVQASGAQTNELSLTLTGGLAARVRCVITNGCGAGGSTTSVTSMRLGPAGDADGDSIVGLPDLAVLIAHWSLATPAALIAADLDDSGSVGLGDVSTIISHWTASCP